MPNNIFFPEKTSSRPKIYAFELIGVLTHRGYIKIGYTTRDVEERINEILHTSAVQHKTLGVWNAMREDGTCFTDHNVHAFLVRKGFRRITDNDNKIEWFECTIDDVRAAVIAIQQRSENIESRTQSFPMRQEQKDAVEKTKAYFDTVYREESRRSPKFLWNAKMRFGKTFTAYQLAKTMGFKRVLVLTFKPAVQSAWREDLLTHIDFEGWQFISNPMDLNEVSIDEQYKHADKTRPIVCFGSFQDFLGINPSTGGIKAKNEWVHEINWDLVIFDEYHFGAWRNSAQQLFDNNEDDYDSKLVDYDANNAMNETYLPITTDYYLYLSGTPFRALNSGEFIEEQIYNWTYSDEQQAKEEWKGPNNPYESLPRMVMMTYRIPDSIQKIAKQGEFDEFDLNVFFSAKGNGHEAKFVYEEYVQKWLDLIRGAYFGEIKNNLTLGAERPPMPYSDTRLLEALSHTLWFLPNVASCQAMANLLKKKNNVFYHDYKINVCAGTRAGIGVRVLKPVQESMRNPLESKTITLSCGKLTTGVTVKPWTGIFMLRNLTSPETYFQAAFRVQSPWELMLDKYDDRGKRKKEIIKKECYVFDFALDRALKQLAEYSCKLNVAESNPEKKVGDFIKFLPVLAYDGSSMRHVNAAEILDIAMAGTSATLLAKRWESALLVNVDNDTLQRLMNNEEALNALMNIEGFRNLNSEIETIINKSESVKKAKRDRDSITPKEKKEITAEEKEYKSRRKQIQKKLIKFATRIPVFMYLTDYREYSLKDVITQLEPELFKKVTGLEIKDFNLLVSLKVFNEALMNDAIYKFKRYEDSSLNYTGVNKHEGESIGLFNTSISANEYQKMEEQSILSMNDNRPKEKYGFFVAERSVKEQAAEQVSKIKLEDISTPLYDKSKVSIKKENLFDRNKVKIGTLVIHKSFGSGYVKKFEDKKITVQFEIGEKLFQYPNAFINGFLELRENDNI